MIINFNFGARPYGHFSATTIILLPCLATMILILNRLFPLVYIIESSYGKEYYYDSNNNLSPFDVMYDNEFQIFGESYEDWTAGW
jgi:hypothetical protein